MKGWFAQSGAIVDAVELDGAVLRAATQGMGMPAEACYCFSLVVVLVLLWLLLLIVVVVEVLLLLVVVVVVAVAEALRPDGSAEELVADSAQQGRTAGGRLDICPILL